MIVDLKNINYDLMNEVETVANSSKKQNDNKHKKKVNSQKYDKTVIEYKKIMKNLKNNIQKGEISYSKWHDKKEKTNLNMEENYEYFDWEMYKNKHDDLKNIKTKNDAWEHWVHYGKKEGRQYFEDKKKKVYDILFSEEDIDNKKREQLFNLNDEMDKIFFLFDWETYKNIHKDLMYISSKEEAWFHLINYGIKEGRAITTYVDSINDKVYEATNISNEITISDDKKDIELIKKFDEKSKIKILLDKDEVICHELSCNQPNLIIKKEYTNYGKHYFGWEKTIQQLIVYLKKYKNKFEFENKIFFDEWIEKLLLWGNKQKTEQYINYIDGNDCNFITFIHNPSFVKWSECALISKLLNEIIYDNSLTNKYLIDLMNDCSLINKIKFIYALSNSHKEYLYKTFPCLQKKIVSVYHPINITKNENCFEIDDFINCKNIWHIGWWLRNFKTYIKDFAPPLGFKKNILIKKDFEINWNKISKNYDISNLNVVYELDDEHFEELFTNSCIFLDLEDCTANNVILECIKFNTPIIIKKLPSTIEYLGSNYPLYFENYESLLLLNDYNYFIENIHKAHYYLKHMNKTHIQLETFNKKIIYDLEKLNMNKKQEKLTWFCLINNNENTHFYLEKFINEFLIQENNEVLNLKFVISDSNYNSSESLTIKNIINKYIFQNNNISYVVADSTVDIHYGCFINTCIYNTHTPYLTILNITDKFDIQYSNVFINYLDSTINADVVFSSYIIKSETNYFQENIVFETNELINYNKISQMPVSNTGMVFRKNITSIVGNISSNSNNKNVFRDFWRRFLHLHMNIICCTDKYMYTIYE